jgi:hypothetical protein
MKSIVVSHSSFQSVLLLLLLVFSGTAVAQDKHIDLFVENTGYATHAKIHPGGKRLGIKDLNQEVCDTYYTIMATNKGSGLMNDSDPIIRDGGRN